MNKAHPNAHIMHDYKRATKLLLKLAANETLPESIRKDLAWAVSFLDIAWSGSVPRVLDLPVDKIVLDRHKAFRA